MLHNNCTKRVWKHEKMESMKNVSSSNIFPASFGCHASGHCQKLASMSHTKRVEEVFRKKVKLNSSWNQYVDRWDSGYFEVGRWISTYFKQTKFLAKWSVLHFDWFSKKRWNVPTFLLLYILYFKRNNKKRPF